MNGTDFTISAVVAPTVRRRLAETIAWCLSRTTGADPRRMFRSSELEPERQLIIEQRLPDGKFEYESLSTEERLVIVQHLADERSLLLAEQRIVVRELAPDLMGGRLLSVGIDWSMWDGLSENESQGFFDVYDTPAWDTWIHLERTEKTDVLLCWVPPPIVPLANGGIWVNCTACIEWVDRVIDSETSLAVPLWAV